MNFELVGARNDPVRNGIRHGTATQLVTAEIGQLGAEGNRSHREITVCAVLCQEVPIHHRWALNITPFGSHPIRGATLVALVKSRYAEESRPQSVDGSPALSIIVSQRQLLLLSPSFLLQQAVGPWKLVLASRVYRSLGEFGQEYNLPRLRYEMERWFSLRRK